MRPYRRSLAWGFSPTTLAAQSNSRRRRTRRTLGVEVKILEVRDPKDFESAFEAGKTGRIGAISVLSSPIFYAHRTRIVSLAAKYRLPASYNQSEFVEVGVLCPMDHHFEICSGALPSM